jgi:hypothetical protein
MAEFEKAFWSISGDNIAINMPIQKVDQERRIVSGWATTDSLDKQGDIVDIDASERAFEKFRGNVREMHTPLSVGKVVAFKRDTYFDKASGKFHNGIFVDVYISKGAQDTWHKVNEGILSGFSIGGNIIEKESIYSKSADAPATLIKEYNLYELSLVDNPANDDSNVVSIQKIGDDIVEKNYLENIFWCGADEPVIVTEKTSYDCPSCNKSMVNIGFVESNDVDKSVTIQSIIDNHTGSGEQSDNEAIDGIAKSIANNNDEKEGNNVGIFKKDAPAEEITKSADEVVEEVVEEASEDTTEAVEEAVEEAAEEVAEEAVAADVDEVVEEVAVEADAVDESTTPVEGNEDLAKAVSDLNSTVADAVSGLVSVVKSLAEEVANLKKSMTEEVASVKSEVEGFGKRVDEVEADTALRKSGDLGGIGQEEKIEKSKWGGRFLNSADLYRQSH